MRRSRARPRFISAASLNPGDGHGAGGDRDRDVIRLLCPDVREASLRTSTTRPALRWTVATAHPPTSGNIPAPWNIRRDCKFAVSGSRDAAVGKELCLREGTICELRCAHEGAEGTTLVCRTCCSSCPTTSSMDFCVALNFPTCFLPYL